MAGSISDVIDELSGLLEAWEASLWASRGLEYRVAIACAGELCEVEQAATCGRGMENCGARTCPFSYSSCLGKKD